MAEDVVVARFRGETNKLVAEINEYIDSLEKLQKEEKDTQAETKKTGDVAAVTAKKRTDSLKGTATELKKVENAAKGAFSQKPLAEFNKNIDKTKENVKGLGGSFGGITQSIKGSLIGIGAGIAAAFSVQAVINFGKASVDAFLDAEKNSERLRFAITTIGGESDAAFERLIKQSADVQKISIFSDDSIQQAQAALAAFGLTSAEIEKLIPQLADFATVTGVDITQAAEQVGAGLEGAGREFKKYGIEVSATATRQENLNSILNGTVQFAGAAEKATTTLSGQLAVLNNKADDLQEQIGEGLAPAFVKAKVAIFEAGIAFLNFIGIIDSEKDKLESDRADSLAASYTNLADRLKKAGKDIEVEFGNSIQKIGVQIEDVKKKNQELTQSIQDRIEAISRSTSNINPADDQLIKSLTKQREENENLVAIFNARIKALQGVISKEQSLKKSVEDSKEVSDVRIASTEQDIQALEKITDTSITAIDRIYLASLKGIQSFRDQVRIEQKAANDQTVDEFEKTLQELNEKRLAANQEKVPFPSFDTTNALNEFLKANAEIISASQQLVGELTQLYGQLAQNQIDSINKAKDAELEAIDTQLTANETALDKRRISETEAFLVEQELLKQQVKAEQEAEKKIRDIKRKQAIADKAAALISITIATAEAVAKALTVAPPAGIALAALYGALGAAQAAIVIAQPIPYKKGTKAAKGGLSLVGEEGPELTMLPANSKVVNARSTAKYSKVIDAMQDDKFDDYVFKNYITPELEKQKRNYQESQEKSFAKNISQSMVLQMAQGGKGDFYLERISKQGLPMSNVDQLASAIASKITQDIYRR